jgi:hypothetical protein
MMPFLRMMPVAFCLLTVAPSSATEIAVLGVSFSDEEGGFTLKGVTGSGTVQDPFIVVEEIFDPRQAVLVIRGMRHFGNRVGGLQSFAMAMRKIVINRTSDVWQNFQLELREVPTRHSPYEDGLSFGQNTELSAVFTVSSFPDLQRFDEPQDTLGFSGQTVAPGESASFQFIVSDTSPVGKIYLYQQPLQPVSHRATPGLRRLAASEHPQSPIGAIAYSARYIDAPPSGGPPLWELSQAATVLD